MKTVWRGRVVEHFYDATNYTSWPANAADTGSVETPYRGPTMDFGTAAFATSAQATSSPLSSQPSNTVAAPDYAGADFGVYDLTYARNWVQNSYPTALPSEILNASVGSIDWPGYTGGFMVANDTNDVVRASTEKTQGSTRSAGLQSSIESQCRSFASAIGSFNSADWTDPTELYQTMAGWGLTNSIFLNNLPNGGRRSTGVNSFGTGDVGQNANFISPSQYFGGPCAWCRPGIGVYVPTSVPLPWQPSPPQQSIVESYKNSKKSYESFYVQGGGGGGVISIKMENVNLRESTSVSNIVGSISSILAEIAAESQSPPVSSSSSASTIYVSFALSQNAFKTIVDQKPNIKFIGQLLISNLVKNKQIFSLSSSQNLSLTVSVEDSSTNKTVFSVIVSCDGKGQSFDSSYCAKLLPPTPTDRSLPTPTDRSLPTDRSPIQSDLPSSSRGGGIDSSAFQPLVYVDLAIPPFDKDPASPFVCANTCGCTDQILNHIPLSIQPNGGFQLLWRQSGTNRCIVSYFDKDFNLVNGFDFEATDVGGIAAYDDGTAVLVSQMECDGPATSETWSTMNRAAVIMWRGGSFSWGTKLTDPYKTSSTTQTNPTYAEDSTGNGQYVLNMGGAQMKHYSSQTKNDNNSIAVYFKQTGGSLETGGDHWGSRVYKLRESDGTVLGDFFGCSHDVLGRLGSSATAPGEYVHVCAQDGASPTGGLVVTAATSGNVRTVIPENTTSQAGWAAARPCSLIARRNSLAGGYVLAHMSKKGKTYYEGIVQVLDPTMNPLARLVVYPNPDSNQTEMANFKLVPYGTDPDQDVYLIMYELLRSPSCCPPTGVENRCYGPVLQRVFQLGQITNVGWRNIGDPYVIPAASSQSWRSNPEDDPIVDPTTGDILWATFNWTQVVFHRISNKSVNV